MPRKSAEDRVLEVMRALGGPCSPGEMVERLEGEYADSTIRNAMTSLQKTGKLTRTKHGVYQLPAETSQSEVQESSDIQAQHSDPIYRQHGSAGDGSFVINEEPIGYITGEDALSRPGRDVFWMPIRGDSMEDTLPKHSMIPVVKMNGGTPLQEDDIYVFRLEDAVKVKRLQRIAGHRIRVISDNPKYPDEIIQLDEGVDFEIIGRVLV